MAEVRLRARSGLASNAVEQAAQHTMEHLHCQSKCVVSIRKDGRFPTVRNPRHRHRPDHRRWFLGALVLPLDLARSHHDGFCTRAHAPRTTSVLSTAWKVYLTPDRTTLRDVAQRDSLALMILDCDNLDTDRDVSTNLLMLPACSLRPLMLRLLLASYIPGMTRSDS
jgi:hypothetical protein